MRTLILASALLGFAASEAFADGDAAKGGCTSLPAVAGYPHVTVPAGFVAGLPVGVSFFGPAHSDAKLLGLAHAFEQATLFRRPPGAASAGPRA